MAAFSETTYGFKWGSAEVIRACSDKKKGWVMLILKTPKDDVQLYVTKTGKLRVFGKRGEWKFPKTESTPCA